MADDRDASWLLGGGEMGELVRARDWAATPLGPIGRWSPELRTAVSLTLATDVPTSLIWGPQHIEIYNDGYRPLTGTFHEIAFGHDFTKTWDFLFPEIGADFYAALAGRAVSMHDGQLFLDRRGFLEEAYFTVSFSPVRDGDGEVIALFHPVHETTSRVLAERRGRLVYELATRPVVTHSLEEELGLVAEVIGQFPDDVPFAVFHRVTAGRSWPVASTGLDRVAPAAAPGAWPLEQLDDPRHPVLLADVQQRFPGLTAGPHGDPIRSALIMPISTPGEDRPVAVMVAGISPRLELDGPYREFHELLRTALSSMAANIRAYQGERRRAEALAGAHRAKTAFFANLSHEFRTPLTLLLAPLEDELAELAAAGDEAGTYRLQVARRNAVRLLRLVNTLLDFARMDAGRLRAVFEPRDLAALTTDIAATFRGACEQAGLQFAVDCPALPQPVWVDRELWEGIVLNLLSNALAFTATGGISVRLSAEPEGARLEVTDTGVGIPETELSQVFERFHRISGPRGRTHEGSGLGLAFVRELVAQHGGTIEVASVVGEGSTFTVRIPFGHAHLPADRVSGSPGGSPARPDAVLAAGPGAVAEAAGPLPEGRVAEPEHPGSAAPAPPTGAVAPGSRLIPLPREDSTPAGRPRIVWAEEDAELRDYVCRLLEAEYDVEPVEDGRAALEVIRREPPTLVLTGTRLPGLDGLGLLRALRQEPCTSTLPVVLVSEDADEESRINGLSAGADDHLAKPFSARELCARIAAHIQLHELRREAEAARAAIDRAAAIEASEAMLRLVTDGVPALISYLDTDGRYRFANRMFQDLLGEPPEQLLGRTVGEVWGIAEAADTSWWSAALAGVTSTRSSTRTDRHGRTRYLSSVHVPDLAPDGTVRGVVGLTMDVTDRVLARRELARGTELLEQRVAQRTRELASTNKELEAFAYSVSHDLRAPLRAIDGFSRILMEDYVGDLPAEAQRYFRLVRDNAQHMSHLIDELLMFSRLSRESLRRRPFDHGELIRGCLAEAVAAEPDRRIEVSIGELPACDGDPTLVRQIWQNLAGNAVKYTRRQDVARIDIRCMDAQQALADGPVVAADGAELGVEDVTGPVYVISDNGAGFDMRHLNKLFGVFQRLHRSDDYEGTGVGLAIVERIVHRHGGRIWARAEVDRGATFAFTLGGSQPEAASGAVPEGEVPNPAGGGW